MTLPITSNLILGRPAPSHCKHARAGGWSHAVAGFSTRPSGHHLASRYREAVSRLQAVYGSRRKEASVPLATGAWRRSRLLALHGRSTFLEYCVLPL